MARDKPLRPRWGTKYLEKSKSTYSSKSRRGKTPELAGNTKIVIERITLGEMLNLTEDNDWPLRGLKVPPRGCFTLGEVQAMSQGGIKNVWWENKHICEFSTCFVIFGGKVKQSGNFH